MFINHAAREINCKIVYYGPGLSGKTTNMQYIYARTRPESKGKMTALATETERSLFFDFVPPSLEAVQGFKVRFHLHTVPGPVFYDESRRMICKGADGVIFVADSQSARFEANIESFENLATDLALNGLDINVIPGARQWNKRDLPDLSTAEELELEIPHPNWPATLAVASSGDGVFETLKSVARPIVASLRKS